MMKSIHYITSTIYFFFFFQAEDGIRDDLVTGVQTCALPISKRLRPNAVLESSIFRSTKRCRVCGWRICRPHATEENTCLFHFQVLPKNSRKIGRASCRERV